MDTPTTPPSVVPAPGSPEPVAAVSTPVVPPTAATGSSRSAQITLGIILILTLGLLAYRGYGNGFGTRPIERASAPITDLNRADRAELEQVPGIGPTLAKEIENYRNAKGPFKSVDGLRQVKGVGPVTLDKVRPYLRVDPINMTATDPASIEPIVLERKTSTPTVAPAPRASAGSKKFQPGDPPIDLNEAGIEELVKLPGIGPVTAQHIVAARDERPFKSVQDLKRVKGIGAKTLEKIQPYLVVK
jgi:competence protein ComEA